MIYSIPLVYKVTWDFSCPSDEITARKNHGIPSAMITANDEAPIELLTPTLLLPVNLKRIFVIK